jgi:hypothetical protein
MQLILVFSSIHQGHRCCQFVPMTHRCHCVVLLGLYCRRRRRPCGGGGVVVGEGGEVELGARIGGCSVDVRAGSRNAL